MNLNTFEQFMETTALKKATKAMEIREALQGMKLLPIANMSSRVKSATKNVLPNKIRFQFQRHVAEVNRIGEAICNALVTSSEILLL
jgi:hypothetical protein